MIALFRIRYSSLYLSWFKYAAEVLGIDSSKLARAALRLGINQLLALASRDVDKAIDLALLNEMRARQ